MKARQLFAATAMTAVLTASCSSSDEVSDPPPTTIGPTAESEPSAPTSAAVTPTPSGPITPQPTSDPTRTSAEAEAASADEQAVIDTAKTFYEGALAAVLRDDSVDTSRLDPWLADPAAVIVDEDISQVRGMGAVLRGDYQLAVLSLELDGLEARAIACLDASATDLVDEDGDSVLGGRALAATTINLGLARSDSAEFGWVIQSIDATGASCGP